MKTIIIIQARSASKRLANKIMLDLCGKPVIEHIYERCEKAKLKEKTIVATTINKEDDNFVEFIKRKNISFYRGSEKNVLERFYFAAKNEKADIIVRVCADSPFIDYNLIDKSIETIKIGNYDYVSFITKNCIGIAPEAFTFSALEKAFFEAREKYQLEHITPYIYENPNKFKLKQIEYFINYNFDMPLRLTLDTEEDFKLIEIIYKNLYNGEVIEIDKVLKFLFKHQELLKINSAVKQKSYKEAEE